MTFLAMTTAQLLVYLTAQCNSTVVTIPESNTTEVYKCSRNPFLPRPKYPASRDKDQSRVEPTQNEAKK